jgi:3-isopropylmalate/(R)-2-methylmalate dehydratase small subunit
MEPFVTLKAVAVPLEVQNVDTDQVIPARFLTRKRAEGLPRFCFYDLRYQEDGSKTDISINDPAFAQAEILVAQSIFGSGSSRESAVWALTDRLEDVQPSGFRCIIAGTFGDIFFNNASKNGLLPVQLPVEACLGLQEQLLASPGATVEVSLPDQVVVFPDGSVHPFKIDAFRKTCLLRGVDEVKLTQELNSEFTNFEDDYNKEQPWLQIA